jgi:uncharacterized membrane protein
MSAQAVLLAMTTGFLIVMLAMSAWVAQRLPAEGSVPVHFDIRGNPDKFGSRWVTLGILPVGYLLLTGLLLWIGTNAPPGEADPAEILSGHAFASVVLLAAHGLIGFLLVRWARQR